MSFLFKILRQAWRVLWALLRRVVFAGFVLGAWQLVPSVHRQYAERYLLRPSAEAVQGQVVSLAAQLGFGPSLTSPATILATRLPGLGRVVPVVAQSVPQRVPQHGEQAPAAKSSDSRALRAQIHDLRVLLEASAGGGR